jgi:hypothetical protein
MGLPKNCKPNNPSGRKVGSTNKATTELKQWVKTLLETNQTQFANDLLQVEAKDRLNIMTALLKYAIPTLQSVSVEAQIQAEYLELEKLLNNAPNEAIEKITEKILTLKNQSNETAN